jgi:DNA processing protein
MERRGRRGEGPAEFAAAARRDRPRLEALGAGVVTRGSVGYPGMLERLADPPPGLFVAGTLPAEPGVAIVGSRAGTPAGRRFAADLGAALAACGLPVVSGLARGIDAAAHEGALAAGGPTVAVLGSGLDRIYPPEHAALASRIRACGALVTEFPLGTPPRPWHFPHRNRLLAAFARAVVVVEAGERSGALITARCALDLGVDVLAVPGPPGAPLARGPHHLIRQGAGLVEGPEDVLEALGIPFSRTAGAGEHERAGEAASPAPRARTGRLDAHGAWEVVAGENPARAESLVLTALAHGPASLDALAERCGLGVGVVAAALLGLELAGLVDPPAGQIYSARPPSWRTSRQYGR